MLDFMGNRIEAGDWLASGGGGNTSAEYGMILYRVLDVKPDSLKLIRLFCSYDDNKPFCKTKKSSSKSPMKFVKIFPSENAMALFMAIEDGFAAPDDHQRAASWIQGRYQFEEFSDDF